MNKIYSKYKLFGGFGLLLGLNLLIGFGAYNLLTNSKISYEKVAFNNDQNAIIAYLIIIGLNLLFLTLLASQCKLIITDNKGILFINPIIPFFRQYRLWTYFDYYILVDENSRYSTHEAVWLIKNGKIKGRFSSFYYTNFNSLKKQIKSQSKGGKKFSEFDQLLILIGFKKI
jgi:hypothetical protein